MINVNSPSLRDVNPLSLTLASIVVAIGAVIVAKADRAPVPVAAGLAVIALGVLILLALKMANQWERAVVLRLGRLDKIAGPGLFLIIPIVDQIAYWIDQRIQTTEFNAQQALSKDTVPVNIDAVIFWQVHDTERAALEIQDYRRAIAQVSETSLRRTAQP